MNDFELEMERKKLADSGCGWKNGVYYKGTPEQEIRKRELSCIEMINSILAYNCRGYSSLMLNAFSASLKFREKDVISGSTVP